MPAEQGHSDAHLLPTSHVKNAGDHSNHPCSHMQGEGGFAGRRCAQILQSLVIALLQKVTDALCRPSLVAAALPHAPEGT